MNLHSPSETTLARLAAQGLDVAYVQRVIHDTVTEDLDGGIDVTSVATVPLELANVYARYGNIRAVEPPVDLPSFAINQYWHPLFHQEPALIWLRDLIKKSFESYPNIHKG